MSKHDSPDAAGSGHVFRRRRSPRRASALLLVGILAIGSSSGVRAEEHEAARYVTTPFLEPDRCATAWVVLRYLDPQARIEFHPREKLPQDGVILFDLPEAALRRDARRATLEALIARHELRDPFVERLAALIHDIEITSFARSHDAPSRRFEGVLVDAIVYRWDAQEALALCLDLLDELRQLDGDVHHWQARVTPRIPPPERGPAPTPEDR